jgi:hypothetical protein
MRWVEQLARRHLEQPDAVLYESAARPRSRTEWATVFPSRTDGATSATFTIREGRSESSSNAGGPTAISRVHGWSSGLPSSTHVGPSQDTPARGSSVFAA